MRKPHVLLALAVLGSGVVAAPARADAPTAPAAAPDAPAAPGPAVPPAADGAPPSAPGKGPEAEVKKEERLRFYGIGLDFWLYDGNSLNKYNYTNDLSFYFIPKWAIGRLAFKGTRMERLNISLRIPLTRTLTGYDESSYAFDSDLGTPGTCSTITPSSNGGVIDPSQVNRCDYPQYHRWQPGDLWLSIGNPRIYTIPKLEVNINPGIRLTLPTSQESRYQTLKVGVGGSLGVNRIFFGDKLTVGYSFGFTKNFHSFSSPAGDGMAGGDGTVGYSANYRVANSITPSASGDAPFNASSFARNASYAFQHIFSIAVAPVNHLSISVLYILTDAFKYGVPNEWVDPKTGMTYPTFDRGMSVAANSGSNILEQAHSDTQIFWATVGYEVTDWMELSLSLITASPQRKADGSLRQPFLSTDYSAFSTVSLGAAFSLEKAAAHLF